MGPLLDENMTLLEEIDLLLAASSDEREPYLARVEDTLSAGYARALALEAERTRLEQRLGAVAADLGSGDLRQGAEELSELSRRVAEADGSLQDLRRRLATLRAHARHVRAVA